MGSPDKNYRENPKRCVFVIGQINAESVQNLTPKIIEMRGESSEPITIYIDSPGGSTHHSEILSGLLKSPNADNNSCRIITVVTGMAASAAADLLASGDYSIAYPKSIVHYHGVRQEMVQDVTMERATLLADLLKNANDQFAIQLAQRSFERFMLLYLFLKSSDFPKIREDSKKRELTDVECFAISLKRKLSLGVRSLIDEALRRYKEVQELDDYVWGNITVEKTDSYAKTEAKILNKILEYELSKNEGKNWSLSAGGLLKTVEDFTVLSDFNFGRQNTVFVAVVDRWRKYFFTPDEQAGHTAAKADPSKQAELERLNIDSLNRMRPIWYFVYSICKILQQKENPLEAVDAYWLGIVDEVLGHNMPCSRLMVENSKDAAKEKQSETAA